MGNKSKIGWTGSTVNTLTGCTKISDGCKFCYADSFLSRKLSDKFKNGFDLTYHPEFLDQPLRWAKPRLIFMNSLSDLFHAKVTQEYIQQHFDMFAQASHHTFQLLTKRSDRLRNLSAKFNWHPNVWMGVSVESQDYVYRVDDLRKTQAKVKFLSCEPLLGPLTLDLTGIDWVIAGGESGKGARSCDVEWLRSIRQQCQEQGVPFFMKQLGVKPVGIELLRKGKGDRLEEWPEDLRVQEWPKGFDRQAYV